MPHSVIPDCIINGKTSFLECMINKMAIAAVKNGDKASIWLMCELLLFEYYVIAIKVASHPIEGGHY